jgi:multicomponent Na+:H+ antiporter subunit D
MTAGLAIGGAVGLAATIFYVIHHIAVKTNLFFVAGTIEHMQGTGSLPRLGGLWKSSPLLSILFLIPAFSLAGIPPFSGFWAKLLILQGAIGLGWFVTAGIALFVGVFTLFSMTKIWNEAFWKNPPRGEIAIRKPHWILLAPSLLLGGVTVAISLFPEWLVQWSMAAAEQLNDPSGYINTVLGTGQ